MPLIFDRLTRKLKRLALIDRAYLHVVQEVGYLRRLFEYLAIDIVFDIGANRGQYATMLRRRVGYRGAIISVEPIPEMADALRHAARGDPLWKVEQVVVGEKPGVVNFNVMSDRECSSISVAITTESAAYQQQTTVDSVIEVESVDLASLVSKWRGELPTCNRPYLKLDTQGMDTRILRATSENTIRQFVAFQSELSVKRLYADSIRMDEALTEYRGYGFSVGALLPNNAGHFPDLIEIDCVMIRDDLTKAREA